MDDRYEAITDKLRSIEEEIRDLTYDQLRTVAASPDSDDAVTAKAEEKRLLQARRAVAKAINALSPQMSYDE